MKNLIKKISTLTVTAALSAALFTNVAQANVSTKTTEAAEAAATVLSGSATSASTVQAIMQTPALVDQVSRLIGEQFTGSLKQKLMLTYQLRNTQSELSQAVANNIVSTSKVTQGISPKSSAFQAALATVNIASVNGVVVSESRDAVGASSSQVEAAMMADFVAFLDKLSEIRQLHGMDPSSLSFDDLKGFLVSQSWANVRGADYAKCLISMADFTDPQVLELVNTGFRAGALVAATNPGASKEIVSAIMNAIAGELAVEDAMERVQAAMASEANSCAILNPALAGV